MEDRYINSKFSIRNSSLLIFLMLFLFTISFTSAFELEKKLIQIEIDEDYPCHIENGDTIVCDAITDKQIDDWKTKIQSISSKIDDGKGKLIDNPEKDKGVLTDANKIKKLDSKKTLYRGKVNKEIDLTKEYREKIDIYDLDDEIKIGFATNVFAVSGTPLENFDVNTTTGEITYAPLNFSYVESLYNTNKFFWGDSYMKFSTGTKINTFAFWLNATSDNEDDLFNADVNGIWEINIVDGNLSMDIVNESSVDHTYVSNISVSNKNWTYVVITINTTHIIFRENNNKQIIEQNGTIEDTFAFYPRADFRDGLQIDELRFYDKSLNDTEVDSLINNGFKCNNSIVNDGLLNYYCMNENSGTRIKDNWIYGKDRPVNSLTRKTDNISVTTLGYDVNISIVNMSNALIYWQNGSLINNSQTGSRNWTFLNNDTFYILDNFNVTEDVSRVNSPLSITQKTSSSLHITNSLDDKLDGISVIFDLPLCDQVGRITYTSDTGDVESFTTGDFTCSGGNAILVLNNIDPSMTSNYLEWTYGCSSTDRSLYNIILIAGSLLILSFIMLYLYKNGNLTEVSVGILIILFVGIVIGINLLGGSAEIIAQTCVP